MCFQDPDGEHARRVLQRGGGGYPGGRGHDSGPGQVNLPPSISNNPNIPPDVIGALQHGRLGSTVFVANVRTHTHTVSVLMCFVQVGFHMFNTNSQQI